MINSQTCKQINFPVSKAHAFYITLQEEKPVVCVPSFTLSDTTSSSIRKQNKRGSFVKCSRPPIEILGLILDLNSKPDRRKSPCLPYNHREHPRSSGVNDLI